MSVDPAPAYAPPVEAARRVLVVDDDVFTATLLADALRGLGWVVQGPLGDAASTLSFVDEMGVPDAALLDLDLGGGDDGIDLAVALRERRRDIGLVLLTAYRAPRLFRPSRFQVPVGLRVLNKAVVRSIDIVDSELHAAIAAPDEVNATALSPATTSDGSRLTDGQVLLMQYVAEGCSNVEIARRLDMGERAVEKAIARLLRRLDIRASNEVNARVMIARSFHRLGRA